MQIDHGKRVLIGALIGSAALLGCKPPPKDSASTTEPKAPMITSSAFGNMPDGAEVSLFTLTNAAGLEVKITNYGGIITSLKAPDKSGKLENIVLGFDSLGAYFPADTYFGALIGRYGNRIGGAKFTLDGKTYKLAANNGPNNLHGGVKGFDKVLWTASTTSDAESASLILDYTSPDGEEGFPGTLKVQVIYRLTADNSLSISYQATTDKATPVNLTHHSYFNLSGDLKSDILGHELQIMGDRITPVDAGLIPTGELSPVAGTPFDFMVPTAIGSRINAKDQQLAFGGGYDHNWVLTEAAPGVLRTAAKVRDPVSGRTLEVLTTEPGVQFYSGNFLNGTLSNGPTVFKHRTGLCLEPQHFPDSPNKPQFPSTILKPGETYTSRTEFKFGAA